MKTVALFVCSVFLLALSAASEQRAGPEAVFAGVGLRAEEAREILADIAQSAYDTPASWSAELRVKRVDLGASPGIVVQGTNLLCGGTGNCQLFVFQQTHGHWVSMFENGHAPIVDAFQFGPRISHGIKDLTVTTNMSANTVQYVRYEFDGRFYRAKSHSQAPHPSRRDWREI